MKKYKICIESYYSNNSDYKEYNNYMIESDSIESARKYAKNILTAWSKKDKGTIYNIFDLWEIIENKTQVDTFKYNGVSLPIYKTSKGYTINNINFYDNIKVLKTTYKILMKKMSGVISY